MRICGVCKLAPRINDPMGTCTVPGDNKHGATPGHYSACSECCAVYEPVGPWHGYVQRFYVGFVPADQTTTEQLVRQQQDEQGILANAPAGYCAVCRRFAREDDTMHAMRIFPEDAPDRPDLFQRGREECYCACGECRRQYAPAILARLKRLGIVPETMTPDQMGPQMFL